MKTSTNSSQSKSSKSLTFVKNCSREGPGLLETFANERDIPFQIIDLETGVSLPDSAQCSAVVILGGPASANDQSPVILSELNFARELLDKGIPVLGICLGLQILAKAGFVFLFTTT